jgi:PTS system mannose-specific IIA component
MVGILLITHAPLGQAFVAALTHIFRERPAQLEVLDVIADQDTELVAQLAQAALARLDTGAGVLVVTDLIGATPANCAGALRLEAPNIEVIAGVSLPMLLRAISYRDNTLDVVSEMALSGGHAGAARLDPRVRLSS